MRRLQILGALVLASAAGLAQLDSYTVTVRATQTLYPQPDQAVINVSLETPLTTGLDDAVNALQAAGVTAANFSGVSAVNGGFNQGSNAIVWSFTLTVPLASIGSTMTSLAQLQQKSNTADVPNLYFALLNLQASPQSQASTQCSTSALMASAQSQALAMAQAAGFRLGAVVALSDGSSLPATAAVYSYATFLVADFLVGIVTTAPPATPKTCTLVAEFSLTTG